jgi:hypothetical protein
MKENEFQKKGDSWYFENNDCIFVVNIQKSNWGGQNYINLGILLKELDKIPEPKEYQCHIRVRLDQIMRKTAFDFNKVLDLENNTISSEDRSDIIKTAFKEQILPFFKKMESLNEIKSTLQSNEYPDLIITLRAKKFLHIIENCNATVLTSDF